MSATTDNNIFNAFNFAAVTFATTVMGTLTPGLVLLAFVMVPVFLIDVQEQFSMSVLSYAAPICLGFGTLRGLVRGIKDGKQAVQDGHWRNTTVYDIFN